MKTLFAVVAVSLASVFLIQENQVQEKPAQQKSESTADKMADEATPDEATQKATKESKDKSEAQKLPPGIVKEKPAKGRSVKVANGYMVPYTATIPGTKVKFEMLPIPGGTFKMGSPESEEDRSDDEGPQIEVTVEPFWMAKYEVSWNEYKQFMRLDKVFKAFQQRGLRKIEGEHKVDAITAPSSLYDPTFTYEAGQGPNQPAATMSQFAAKQYTKWLSLLGDDFYRLPYEAEWEYACRAGTTTAFYFGDDADDLEDHAWYWENSDEERHDCGELKPNPWGLYDMYGNVAEWVLDKYSEDGYAHVKNKKGTAADVYTKPDEPYPLVLRGGSWELEAEDCRSASRFASDDEDWKGSDPNYPQSPWWYTDSPGLGTGFRIIRPYKVPKTRKEKEVFWDAGLETILDDAKNRIDANGRGAFGYVDPKLPDAIGTLTDEDR